MSRLRYRRLVRATWRRPYAAPNAFEACFRPALTVSLPIGMTGRYRQVIILNCASLHSLIWGGHLCHCPQRRDKGLTLCEWTNTCLDQVSLWLKLREALTSHEVPVRCLGTLLTRQCTRKCRTLSSSSWSPWQGRKSSCQSNYRNLIALVSLRMQYSRASPLIGKHGTFGCELEFVSMNTQTILADPILDTLQECNCFSLVVRQCFIQGEHEGQLRRRAKA